MHCRIIANKMAITMTLVMTTKTPVTTLNVLPISPHDESKSSTDKAAIRKQHFFWHRFDSLAFSSSTGATVIRLLF